ncbi:OsmC family protein [Flavobacterium rhizosphaerae]|uniref:OsmC family protein n=1 Tax=Flavobacterium rhizosphaerae TaxID=3163298 RepID=A0ABW8YTZ8_9FLAO
MTSKITYLGDLRTSSVHIQSGEKVISDAPVDNNGKGEAFSPTDIVANALGSCMLTIMGIKARDMQVAIEGSTAEVTKVMQSSPRMIAEINIVFTMKSDADKKSREILERAALTCPVHLSLHPDVKRDIVFNWQ